jgi:hypothetical protein
LGDDRGGVVIGWFTKLRVEDQCDRCHKLVNVTLDFECFTVFLFDLTQGGGLVGQMN